MTLNEQTQHLLALSLIPKLGPVTARNLISWCGGVTAVFNAARTKLLGVPGIGHSIVNQLSNTSWLKKAEAILKQCEVLDIQIFSFLDPAFPDMLKSLYDAPLLVYQRGAGMVNAQPAIAIVGTRKATDYGKQTASEFAAYFAERGINVVSGLAYGIDYAAHKACLAAGGQTTAVLAHGLESIYPGSHTAKAMEILKSGNWISEYPPGSKIDPGNFPARNRIIAGLSRATLIIEASQKGGALITGRFAFDQNREVYAVPGRLQDSYARGCNALIRDQIAKLVTSPEEILIDLGLDDRSVSSQCKQLELELPGLNLPHSEEEQKVLTFLNRGEALVDSISIQTRIPPQRLNPLLLAMEFRGLVRQMPGKKFRRL
ncbi:MAG: DNA-processing protein DprA [Bacteroidia bacterium]